LIRIDRKGYIWISSVQKLESVSNKDLKLKKDLGLLQLTAMGIGAIIGAGIFIAPAGVASVAGPLGIISWIAGGLIMSLIALFYAELGGMRPTTSGFYVYARETSGDFPGFMSGWGTFLSYATTVPIELYTIMFYMTSFVPGLASTGNIPIFGVVNELTYRGLAVALILLWALTLINVIGVKYGGWYATATTGLKLAALFSFLAAGIFLVRPSNYGFLLPRDQAGSGVLLGISATVFSYMGFRQPSDVGGEVKNAKRIIPLATLISMGIATLVYVSVGLVFTGMINWAALGITPGSWSSVPSNLTLAEVARLDGALPLALLITVGIIISALGTAGVFTTTTARVPYQMAEGGLLTKVHERYATPNLSLIVKAIFQSVLMFFSIGYWALYYVSAISGVFSYGISGPLATMIYRAKGLRSEFSVPFARVLAPIAFVASSLLVYWSAWPYTGYGTAFVASGIALYLYVKVRKGGVLSAAREIVKSYWLIAYIVGLMILSYLGPSAFNGVNFIPFPYDELIVVVFSLGIYYAAYLSNARSFIN
jgi:amino acid transporter